MQPRKDSSSIEAVLLGDILSRRSGIHVVQLRLLGGRIVMVGYFVKRVRSLRRWV